MTAYIQQKSDAFQQEVEDQLKNNAPFPANDIVLEHITNPKKHMQVDFKYADVAMHANLFAQPCPELLCSSHCSSAFYFEDEDSSSSSCSTTPALSTEEEDNNEQATEKYLLGGLQ